MVKTMKKMTAALFFMIACLAFGTFAQAEGVAKFVNAKGKVYKTIKITSDSEFPALAYKGGYTFQGWALKKGLDRGAKYQEGQAIPDGNATYYPVIMANAKESAADPIVEAKKHSYVYLVGDSRMAYASKQFGKKLKKTRFIAKSGKGYAWFAAQGGYDELIEKIEKDGKTKKKKAVVFLLGVNDMQNLDLYLSTYRDIAPNLRALNCDLYVASVNPFSARQRETYKHAAGNSQYVERRRYEQKAAFNKAMKKLDGYQYVDVSKRLFKIGFCYVMRETPDGLHYTKTTNQKILSYVLKTVG